MEVFEGFGGNVPEDSSPRSAPKPTSFTQITKVTQVPEVSLVFSPTWPSRGDTNNAVARCIEAQKTTSVNINHYDSDHHLRYNGSHPSRKIDGWSVYGINSEAYTQDVKHYGQVNLLTKSHSANSKYSANISGVRTVVTNTATVAPSSQRNIQRNTHHSPCNVYSEVHGNYVTRASSNANISQCSLPKEPPKPASPYAGDALKNGPLLNVSLPSNHSCQNEMTLEDLECNIRKTHFIQQASHLQSMVDCEGRSLNRQKLDCRSVPTAYVCSPGKRDETQGKVTTGQQTEKSETVSQEFQDLLAMNQKQCDSLHSLLQQVVALQVDQMKILVQMDERLSNLSSQSSKEVVPENKPPPQCDNASTQTSFVEEARPCQCHEEKHNLPKNDKDSPKVRREEDWMRENVSGVCEEELTLHGIRVSTVIEPPPSPGPPMSLRINEYDSSSCESVSACNNRGPPHPSPIGVQNENRTSWTLYNNIVGHVKRFLHSSEDDCETNVQKNPSVEAIRFATLEKIKQLEVSLYENSTEIKEVSTRRRVQFAASEKGRTDSSLEVHTLAMKYLQDDELCELAMETGRKVPHAVLKDSSKSPNVSLATRRYLEKYHLLPPGAPQVDNQCVYKDRKQMHVCAGLVNDDKILDVTTLKKQPKLL